jgi:hypothetical protein
VRSELLFTILWRLQAAQVPMAAVFSAASVPGAMGPSLAPAAPTASAPSPLTGAAADCCR